jgi:RNA polymerase sigma-70 factor (ECF subfamily)
VQHLVDILAPDVVFLGDGGGVKQAVLRPVEGAERVARVLAAGLSRITELGTLRPARVNGYPALTLSIGGKLDTVLAVRLGDGLITGLYAMRNPGKLSHMESETALGR